MKLINAIRITSKQRIGPHNLDILSILFGSLLGDGHGECRTPNSVRFTIKQSNINVEYLRWLHKFFSDRKYCNSKKPQLKILIGKENKKYFYYKFNTFTYSNLLYFYYMFYPMEFGKIKKIPVNPYLWEYLTPQALAVWFMDDGSKGSPGGGVVISTVCFSYEDLQRLTKFLKQKYNLDCTLQCQNNKYRLYILKKSMPMFSSIVKKYMVSSMYYKLNGF